MAPTDGTIKAATTHNRLTMLLHSCGLGGLTTISFSAALPGLPSHHAPCDHPAWPPPLSAFSIFPQLLWVPLFLDFSAHQSSVHSLVRRVLGNRVIPGV